MSMHINSISFSTSPFSDSASWTTVADHNRGLGEIIASDLNCDGTEYNLGQCGGSFPATATCTHDDDVYVNCLGGIVYLPHLKAMLTVHILHFTPRKRNLKGFMGVTIQMVCLSVCLSVAQWVLCGSNYFYMLQDYRMKLVIFEHHVLKTRKIFFSKNIKSDKAQCIFIFFIKLYKM